MSNENQPPKKGLKLTNEKSSVQSPKPPPAAVFDEKVKEAMDKREDYKKRAWELSARYKSHIENKTLTDNKSPIVKDLEAETISKLILLASELDADETQPEGLGSITLGQLCMKMLLVQRDKINSLSYELEKLSKQIKDNDLKSTLPNDK